MAGLSQAKLDQHFHFKAQQRQQCADGKQEGKMITNMNITILSLIQFCDKNPNKMLESAVCLIKHALYCVIRANTH